MTAEEIFRGRLVMAPMTRGTDLPFRRLATEWGAEVCVGEMAYAHKVVKLRITRVENNSRDPDCVSHLVPSGMKMNVKLGGVYLLLCVSFFVQIHTGCS